MGHRRAPSSPMTSTLERAARTASTAHGTAGICLHHAGVGLFIPKLRPGADWDNQEGARN